MKRFFSLCLVLGLLSALCACGQQKQEPTAVSYDSVSQVGEALGYELLAIEKNSANLTFSSAAVLDDVIGQVDYETGDSAVELRMTLDEDRFDGLAGYENAGKAGGIDAPADVFSRLELYVVDGSTYFCEFSYTYEGYTCYLSLAETNTDFDAYSILLINYVNQIYNLEDVPDFVYALDPDFGKEEETATQAASSAEGASSEDASSETDEGAQTEPESGEADEDADKDSADADEGEKETDSGSITLEYYDITLVNIGDTYTFSPSGGEGSYTWESADTAVATVSGSGTVTAVGSGQTTVTCTSGDVSVEVIVRVK